MQDENGLHDHLITLQQLQNLPHFDFDRLACVCVLAALGSTTRFTRIEELH